MLKFLKSFKLLLLILFGYLKRHFRILIAYSSVVIIIIFIIFKFGIVNLKPNFVSEGIVGTYQTQDLPEQVTRLLSKGLVKVDENGRIVPDLAKGWEVNNDSTIYKFKLRGGLYFSDGTAIRSQDLEFNIPDIEVSFPDNLTIQFKLKDSFSPFPSLLTKPVFKKKTLIGVGPYKVKRVETSRIFITKMVLEPSNNLPKLVIRFYPNEPTALTAYSLGEVQALLGLTDPKKIERNIKSKLLQKTTYSRVVAIFYNTQDKTLSNRSIRQALSFVAPAFEGEVRAKSPIPPFSWAFTADTKKYLSNPNEAKAALDRAKSPSNDEVLKVEIILTSVPQFEEIGKQVVSSWQSLGFKALLRVESGIPQNFQALLIAQSIPQDPDQYSLWHSTQTKTNLTKYVSARIDKDLEDGRKLPKEEERRLKYFDFQIGLLEDAPATFLYFPKYNIVYLKKIEDKLNKILPIQLIYFDK